MSSLRRASLAFAALLAGGAGAVFFNNDAMAQSVGEDRTPPPPPDEEEGEPAVPPPEAMPPAQPPDQTAFEEGLSRYGRWVDRPEYGRVWVPSDTGPDWQPYTDGHWVETDFGWSFASSVPWGWAVFHYGRWGFGLGLGWFWVPGFVWAPAWVAWRYYPGYVCWSSFAPNGFVFGRQWPGWVVLPGIHFTHPIPRFRVPRPHAAPIVRAANPVTSIASARGHGNFRGAGSLGNGGKVPTNGNIRGGGAFHGGRSFHRSSFRSSRLIGRGEVLGGRRSFGDRGAPRGWNFGGVRTLGGTIRSGPVASHGLARRR